MAIKYYVFSTKYTCPHCGNQYDYTATSTGFFGGREHRFTHYLDSPVKICAKCGQPFIDHRFTEYVSLDEKGRNEYFDNYKSKGPIVWIVILSIYAISGIIATIAAMNPLMLIMTGIAIICMIAPIVILAKRLRLIDNHIFDKAIVQSLHRCEEKDYLLQLIALGEKIYPLTEKEILSNPEFSVLNKLINEVNNGFIPNNKQNLGKGVITEKIPQQSDKNNKTALKDFNVGDVLIKNCDLLSYEDKGIQFESMGEFMIFVARNKNISIKWIENKDALRLFHDAYSLYEDGKTGDCILKLKEALTLNPIFISARFELVNSLATLKEFEKAKEVLFDMADYIYKDSDCALFYRRFGYIFIETAQPDLAYACYRFSQKFDDNPVAKEELRFIQENFKVKVADFDVALLLNKHGIPFLKDEK